MSAPAKLILLLAALAFANLAIFLAKTYEHALVPLVKALGS